MKRYTIGLITGILLGMSAMMFMGAQNKNLGDITVSSITIAEKNNSEKIVIENDILMILGKESVVITSRLIAVRNEKKKAVVAIGMDDDGRGLLDIYDSDQNQLITLTSSTGNDGVIVMNNSKGNEIVYLGANIDDDGLIRLSDRYGDVGWGQTGKK